MFYAARLPLVVNRLAELTFLTGAFNARLLLDLLAYRRAGSPEGESWPNEADRAREALEVRCAHQSLRTPGYRVRRASRANVRAACARQQRQQPAVRDACAVGAPCG